MNQHGTVEELSDRPAVGSWQLDPRSSSVEFRVKHFWGIVTVKGRFTVFQGQLVVEPSGTLTGTMSIDAASVDTKNQMRDSHLRSEEFFGAERYPTITFATREVDRLGEDRFRVIGDLTAAGRTEEIGFEARITSSSVDRVSVAASITIDRTRFGMTWGPLGMTSHSVVVTIAGELVHVG